MPIEMTKNQIWWIRLYHFANNKKIAKKSYTMTDLAKFLEGAKYSGHTKEFLKGLVNYQILVYDSEELMNGHYLKKYKINFKKLEDYISHSEFYTLASNLVEAINPRLI